MISKGSYFLYVSLFLLSTLVFILPIPHTIAVRNGLLYLLLISLLYFIIKVKKDISFSLFKNNIIKLFLLLFFVILCSSLFSDNLKWSLDEFRGQWLTSSVYFILGIFFTKILIIDNQQFSKENFITLIFYSFFLHIIYIDLMAFYEYFNSGILLSRYGGIVVHPTIANYITNICLAFLFSEIIYRIRTKQKVININTVCLSIFFLMTLFSSIVESMRNGSVSIIFMIVISVFFLFYNNKKIKFINKTLIIICLFSILIIPLLYNIKTDKRWDSLIDTIPIGIDTTNNLSWLDNKVPYPKLKNGQTVNGSNYLRIAFLSEGIIQIYKKPLGIGYSRNAFGFAMQEKYGKGRGMHAHSSIIDFTIGVGIQGLLLWSIFIYFLLKISIDFFKEKINYYSILLFYIVTGFFLRSFVDSNMRDHIIIHFFLLLGILITILFYMKADYEKTKIYQSK